MSGSDRPAAKSRCAGSDRDIGANTLRVGQAEVELHFERTPRGTLVAVGRKSGELTVVTER